MLNYHELVTLAVDRQAAYLADAEQRWLVEQVTAGQLHPVRVWLGQRLIAWGARLMRGNGTPIMPLTTETVARY
ncbi:MAG: hypothetical protein DYG89_13910 [Caldilinea sp. CFX5]|nr:hypothetical protein [Caldilinea sp. CFX5]